MSHSSGSKRLTDLTFQARRTRKVSSESEELDPLLERYCARPDKRKRNKRGKSNKEGNRTDRSKSLKRNYSSSLGPHHTKFPPLLSKQMGMANTAYVNKQFDEAIALLTDIIGKYPQASESYYTLSMIYEDMGDKSRCFNNLLISALLMKNNMELWKRLVDMSIELGKRKEAIYCLRKLGKKESNKKEMTKGGKDEERVDDVSKEEILWIITRLYAEEGRNIEPIFNALKLLLAKNLDLIEHVELLAKNLRMPHLGALAIEYAIKKQNNGLKWKHLESLLTLRYQAEQWPESLKDLNNFLIKIYSSIVMNYSSSSTTPLIEWYTMTDEQRKKKAMDEMPINIKARLLIAQIYAEEKEKISLISSSPLSHSESNFASLFGEIDQELLENIGDAFYNKELYEEAIVYYLYLVKESPSVSLCIKLGNSYRTIGKYSNSLEIFRTLLEVITDNSNIKYIKMMINEMEDLLLDANRHTEWECPLLPSISSNISMSFPSEAIASNHNQLINIYNQVFGYEPWIIDPEKEEICTDKQSVLKMSSILKTDQKTKAPEINKINKRKKNIQLPDLKLSKENLSALYDREEWFTLIDFFKSNSMLKRHFSTWKLSLEEWFHAIMEYFKKQESPDGDSLVFLRKLIRSKIFSPSKVLILRLFQYAIALKLGRYKLVLLACRRLVTFHFPLGYHLTMFGLPKKRDDAISLLGNRANSSFFTKKAAKNLNNPIAQLMAGHVSMLNNATKLAEKYYRRMLRWKESTLVMTERDNEKEALTRETINLDNHERITLVTRSGQIFLAIALLHDGLKRTCNNPKEKIIEAFELFRDYYNLNKERKEEYECEEGWFNMARASHMLGLYDMACQLYDKVIKINNQGKLRSYALYNLHLIYLEMGSANLAMETIRQIEI